jgi:hypothetical protein
MSAAFVPTRFKNPPLWDVFAEVKAHLSLPVPDSNLSEQEIAVSLFLRTGMTTFDDELRRVDAHIDETAKEIADTLWPHLVTPVKTGGRDIESARSLGNHLSADVNAAAFVRSAIRPQLEAAAATDAPHMLPILANHYESLDARRGLNGAKRIILEDASATLARISRSVREGNCGGLIRMGLIARSPSDTEVWRHIDSLRGDNDPNVRRSANEYARQMLVDFRQEYDRENRHKHICDQPSWVWSILNGGNYILSDIAAARRWLQNHRNDRITDEIVAEVGITEDDDKTDNTTPAEPIDW